jgi:hypothetical protein
LTPTVTSTRIATLTPAQPQAQNSRYQLTDWNLINADRMITLLNAQAEPNRNPEWFNVAVYAQGEALLRYPQAFEATHWRWLTARNLIHTGNPTAIVVYTGLIQEALSTGQVRSEDLTSWFQVYEPDLILTTFSFPAQTGELDRLLIQISGAGNAFLWLIETPGNVQVYSLLSDFEAADDPQTAFLLQDLTGDGSDELIIFRTSSPNQTQFPTPWIFDLTQIPPAQIPIQPGFPINLGMESERLAVPVRNSQSGYDLQLTARLFPACPVEITELLHWDGVWMARDPLQYQLYPDTALLAWCEVLVDHATLVWDPDAALTIAEPLLESWPPAENTEGHPYPADASDAWRFRLGMLNAFVGQQAEADRYFQSILETPAIPQSSWIEPARRFLDIYQSPEDLYLACLEAPGCNMRLAMQAMVRDSGLDDPALVLDFLRRHGVVTRMAGEFDFDGDGIHEQWMSVLPEPGGTLEFWILTAAPSGVQAVFVQIFEDNQPQPYYHDPLESPLVVQLELGRGFILERDPVNGSVAVRFVDVEYSRPTEIRDALDLSIEALFSGTDPYQILSDLIAIGVSPRFAGDCNAFGICARYYYTLGLVHELTGDELNAIDAYLTVWRLYPHSPYTIMARLKLNLLPATPTFTPTATSTITPTGTITPTSNMTPTPSTTTTSTPTETSTSTPTP